MGNFKPPVELLWEKYSYNLFTGRFHRVDDDRELRGNSVGSMSRSHQLSISQDHRYPYGVCVFAWLNGRWPADGLQVDHINRDPFDHRPWNIREVTRRRNLDNRERSGRLSLSVAAQHPPSGDLDSLPDFLKEAIQSVSSPESHTGCAFVDCSPSQSEAIHAMGWSVPVLGSKVITCYKPATRRRLTPASRFYDAAIAALGGRAIHIGDLAHLWLAVVSSKVKKPSWYCIAHNLSRILGHSILIKDGHASIGERVLDLVG